MPPRRFQPYLLAELGGHLLVVDDTQPVAVLVGPAGRITSVASWPEVAPPPQAFDDDRRRVLHRHHDLVCVADEPTGPSVVLSRRGGELTVEQHDGTLAD